MRLVLFALQLALAAHAFLLPPSSREGLRATQPACSGSCLRKRAVVMAEWRKWQDRAPSPRPGPINYQPLRWSTNNQGRLCYNYNGQWKPFTVNGINWYGFEDGHPDAEGLSTSLTAHNVAGFLEYHHFNAVRLPVSLPFALELDTKYAMEKNELLRVIRALGDLNILVMLDMHRLYQTWGGDNSDRLIHPLWWSENFSEEQFVQGWDNIMNAVKGEWNVFAIDLKNEPHKGYLPDDQQAKWDSTYVAGRKSNDWNLFATELIEHILKWFPEYQGLFFVEGVEDQRSSHVVGWGGSVKGHQTAPITVRDGDSKDCSDRVVLSPHVYGPSVRMRDYLKDYFNQKGELRDDDTELKKAWYEHWAFVKDQPKRKAVVIGEWGGYCGERNSWNWPSGERWGSPYNDREDRPWHFALAKYMRENGFEDQFYWCLNPSSGDSGGFIPNWDSNALALKPVDSKALCIRSIYANRQPYKIGRDGVEVNWTREWAPIDWDLVGKTAQLPPW